MHGHTTQVLALLNSLDRRRSYFSVTHFAELLKEERILVPCDLKVAPPCALRALLKPSQLLPQP